MVVPVVCSLAHPPHPPFRPIPLSLQFAVLPAHRLRVSLRCGAAPLPVSPPTGCLAAPQPAPTPITRLPSISLPVFLILSWHGVDISRHRLIGARDILLPRLAARPIIWHSMPAASIVVLRTVP